MTCRRRFCGAVYALLILGYIACTWSPRAHAAGDEVDFARDIGPLLEQHCIRCHQPQNRKGDLSLATADDVTELGFVVPGLPDQSYLLDVVGPGADGGRPQMPKEGTPLTDAARQKLRSWIAAGATWPSDSVLRERSKADARWWSLQPLAAGPLPDPAGIPEAWRGQAIDRFVYARLAENGLTPNPPADRATLIRRVSLDLTGLPPSPADVESFLADDSPTAYEALVDRLLASPHYGEQWGRHWLDVVRFGESNGYERNVLINNAWPFRDYVIRSFNEDKPFDQLVLEHLAGTTFLVCGPYDNVGNQDAVQAAVIRATTIDEVIRATGEAFLGITIGCARCHDHKFDPILQKDYYGWYSTFAGVHHGDRIVASPKQQADHAARVTPLREAQERLGRERNELDAQIAQRAEAKAEEYTAVWTRPPVDRYGTEETFAASEARYVRLTVQGTDTNPHLNSGFRIDEFEVWSAESPPRNVALASLGARAEGASRRAGDFTDAYGPQLTIDGRFGAEWLAAGPQLTITLAEPAKIARVYFSSDRPRALPPRHDKTTFVGDYRLEVSLDGTTWTEMASSRDRKPPSDLHRRQRLLSAEMTETEGQRLAELDQQLAQVNAELAAIAPLPVWWVGQYSGGEGPFHVFLGGDPQRKGDVAQPTGLQAVTRLAALPEKISAEAPEHERRLALARWIVAPQNPLTARVLANRLWHYHFGTGIVDTPSDFGYMGGRPTHPELLDWLAAQVHEHDWRLKPLHKMLLMSQSYRQASTFRQDAALKDADARLLWRYPPRRMSAEQIRDSMLSVAGQLDTRMGGPGFRLYQYLEDNVATYVPLDEHGPETFRRAVYHQNARASRVDVLSDFDCPDPAFAAPRRAATTTPLQALTLMNHPFVLHMAEALAARVAREAGESGAQPVGRAFQLTLAREPDATERSAAESLVQQHGLTALCRALLNCNEFIYLK
jgi:mono/diheme cytochrome c family protein